MELKDFISNTIEQISLGILEASKKCNQYGVIVNPNITIGEQGDFCIPLPLPAFAPQTHASMHPAPSRHHPEKQKY